PLSLWARWTSASTALVPVLVQTPLVSPWLSRSLGPSTIEADGVLAKDRTNTCTLHRSLALLDDVPRIRQVTHLPNRIRVVEHLWIPLADGCRLAAKLWLPANAETAPAPGIVEYIPYRKRDMTAVRDSTTHAYLAGHGYACLRVDVRGTGDSEGLY